MLIFSQTDMAAGGNRRNTEVLSRHRDTEVRVVAMEQALEAKIALWSWEAPPPRSHLLRGSNTRTSVQHLLCFLNGSSLLPGATFHRR